MKRIILLLIIFFLIPLAYAQDLCVTPVEPLVNCTVLSPPLLNCSLNFTYSVINSSGNSVQGGNLSLWNGSIYNFTFSQPIGTYAITFCSGKHLEVTSLKVTWEESSMFIIAAIILLPMLLSLIMLVGAATMGENHNALRIGLFLLSIIPFFSAMHFGVISIIKFIPGFTELQEAIGSTVYWVGIIFFILVSYFFIYMIYSIFTNLAEKKKERLEY